MPLFYDIGPFLDIDRCHDVCSVVCNIVNDSQANKQTLHVPNMRTRFCNANFGCMCIQYILDRHGHQLLPSLMVVVLETWSWLTNVLIRQQMLITRSLDIGW